jgi:homoserine O-acetyltransferase/O-succinyltransferase
LRKHLGIAAIQYVIGGSMGGQQALEWACQEPDVVKRVISVAANAIHSPWGIAWNESQRMAIRSAADQAAGLGVARAMAMLSYRSATLYNNTQQRRATDESSRSVVTYQHYQAQALQERFTAEAYVALTKIMDSHDIGLHRGSVGAALRSLKMPALIVGIPSDILFPEQEQLFIADMMPNSVYKRLHSIAGHDAFLLQQQQLAGIISQFINNNA